MFVVITNGNSEVLHHPSSEIKTFSIENWQLESMENVASLGNGFKIVSVEPVRRHSLIKSYRTVVRVLNWVEIAIYFNSTINSINSEA